MTKPPVGVAWLAFALLVPSLCESAPERPDGEPRRPAPRAALGAATESAATPAPFPRLEPIDRFVPPIEPWVEADLGWGVAAIREDGEAVCSTNRPPATSCDSQGPRPFLHTGFDASPASDRLVRASAAGRVAIARATTAAVTGRDLGEGGGIVVLEHDLDGDPGTLDDRVATIHQHVIPSAVVGQIVRQGDIIARTSTIGGDHLHFGVRRGPVDPADLDLFRTLLPPTETDGCLPCFGRSTPLPAFPDEWEDPQQIFRAPARWAAIYKEGHEGASDVLETDGGYIAAGWTRAGSGSADMWILRLDGDGQVIAQRAYGGARSDMVRRLQPTPDGGFVALAASDSFRSGPGPLLLKFAAGAEAPSWQRAYVASASDWGEDIKVTADGGFVIAGAMQRADARSSALVVKLDAHGAVDWARAYSGPQPESSGGASAIAQTADGGYVVVGNFSYFGASLVLFRIDAAGHLLWARNVGLPGDMARQIETTPDGGIVMVGTAQLAGPTYLWLARFLADGTPESDSLYGTGSTYDRGLGFTATDDGGYVVAGGTRREVDGLRVESDLWILRVDAQGAIVEQRRIDTRGFIEAGMSVRPTRDGGYIMAGGADVGCQACVFEGDTAFAVVKTDADLAVPEACGVDSAAVRLPRISLPSFHPLQESPIEITTLLPDTTAVETAAERITCQGGFYGPPPIIQDASISWFSIRSTCDFTAIVEATACQAGIPEVRAAAPILVEVLHDVASATARVTDPDSTPERDDLVSVDLALGHEGVSVDELITMEDDGSAALVPWRQTSAFWSQNCFYDRSAGICGCTPATYATYSGDTTAADGNYTRAVLFLTPSVGSLGVDCAVAAKNRFPRFAPVVRAAIRATDRQGNVSIWEDAVPDPGVGSVACSGDACGCCLLFSLMPVEECAGSPGLTSPDFPAGLCRSF